MRLYLAHAISDRQRIREAELRLENELGIDLQNPFYDRDRPRIREMDSGTARPYLPDVDFNKVVDDDLAHIVSCDGLLAVIGRDPSIGMPMEIFYNSHVLRRPTYLVIEEERLYNHSWLRKYATERFHSIDEFKSWYKDRQRTKIRSL
jgi:hypothetical protein